MVRWIKNQSKRALAWWTLSVVRRPLLVVFFFSVVTPLILGYTVRNFRIDTELGDMISDEVPYRKLEREFRLAFPQLANTILVVIDADAPETAIEHRKRLADRLKQETGVFRRVQTPGGGEFFEQNGLLYLSVDELEDLADNLANVQPFLGLLSRDLSLRGLLSVVEEIVRDEEAIEDKEDLIPLFDRLSEAFDRATSGERYRLSWQELIIGEERAEEMSRQFIVIEAVRDYGGFTAGEAAIETVRRAVDELGLTEANGIRVRLTGDLPLARENLLAVRSGIGIAALASFVLVAVVLVVGLGSGRLVLVAMTTLLVGLIWTVGFAIAAIGRLNLISAAFAVLFIGLGIDYSIQLCLRYRELLIAGMEKEEAVTSAVKDVGGGLLLCTVTTATGFYSFVPTAYAGVSELGWISGTGMFINLMSNVTMLPALLILMPLRREGLKKFKSGGALFAFPYRHPKLVRVSAVAIAFVAVLFVPRVFFDYNPLNLYDPASESLATITDLFEDDHTSPWTVSAIVEDRQEAESLAHRMRELNEVDHAITLFDLVPDNQSEKLDIISTIALLMPPEEDSFVETSTYSENVDVLKGFDESLQEYLSRSSNEPEAFVASAGNLHRAVERFMARIDVPNHGKEAMTRLEDSLLAHLPFLLDNLRNSLQAREFDVSDLPKDIRSLYVTADGRYRVEITPRENLLNHDELEEFVSAVTLLAPNAIQTPVSILEAGRAVVASFRQATLYAILAISLLLLIQYRSLVVTLIVLLPLLFALLMTGAASVLLNIHFNFANVIVIPLLLGIGVDSGIHFMHRFRTAPPTNDNMLETSTARAVFLSTLTTILSFGSLSFSPHQGMASMGKLLTLCVAFLTLATFFLLPVVLNACARCRKSPDE